MQHTVTHYDVSSAGGRGKIRTMKHTATHRWNTLQHTATFCNASNTDGRGKIRTLTHPTTHRNTLQHTATHCNASNTGGRRKIRTRKGRDWVVSWCHFYKKGRWILFYWISRRWHRRQGAPYWYGVATISRLLKIIGFFRKRALYKRLYSAKEAYNLNRKQGAPRRIDIRSSVCLYILEHLCVCMSIHIDIRSSVCLYVLEHLCICIYIYILCMSIYILCMYIYILCMSIYILCMSIYILTSVSRTCASYLYDI